MKTKAGKPNFGLLQTKAGRRANYRVILLSWLFTAASVMVIIAAGRIIDVVLHPEWSSVSIPWWVLGISGVCLLGVAKFFIQTQTVKTQVEEENRLRRRVLGQVFNNGPVRITGDSSGKIASLATQSVERFVHYRQGFRPVVIGSFSAPILIILAMGLFVNPFLALLLAICVPLIPLLIRGFQKLFRRSSQQSSQARSDLSSKYLDALGGLTTLQLLGAAKRYGDQLEQSGEENRLATMRVLRSNQIIIFVLDAVFSLLAITSVAVMSLYLVASESLTPGRAVSALGLAMLLLEPIDHFGAFFYVAMGGRGAGRALLGFFRGGASRGIAPRQAGSNQDGIGSRKAAPSVQIPGTDKGPTTVSPTGVSIQDLSFGYGNTPVLNSINLEVKPGERVAIIGPSGQGKTTLLHLIKGFLEPASGQVKVAGTSGGRMEQSALVSQNTWLFTGTLRENLELAAPGVREDELWTALQSAHLEGEVRRMPRGLDTALGENGFGLSTGQKQRLSLARALVSGRKLLLLDEVTSQVDLNSEREILAALADLGRDYTLIMVTHREAVTAIADRVLTVGQDGVLS